MPAMEAVAHGPVLLRGSPVSLFKRRDLKGGRQEWTGCNPDRKSWEKGQSGTETGQGTSKDAAAGLRSGDSREAAKQKNNDNEMRAKKKREQESRRVRPRIGAERQLQRMLHGGGDSGRACWIC